MPRALTASDDNVVTFSHGYLEPRPASSTAAAFAADPETCDSDDPAGAYRLVRLVRLLTGGVLCVVDPISGYGRTRSVTVPPAALATWKTLANAIAEESDDRIGVVVQPDSPDVPGLPAHLVSTPAANPANVGPVLDRRDGGFTSRPA
jgi:hypothetical protein